jgi:hypothetical protein
LLFFAILINSCSKNNNSGINDSSINEPSPIILNNPYVISSTLHEPNPLITNKIDARIKIMINDNELNYDDVQLNYFETTFELNKILMDVAVIIKNPELVSQLKEIINPIIYLEIDNRKYSPKGIIYEGPTLPPSNYEIRYFLHETGRLYFFNNSFNDSIIRFSWYEDRQY